LSSSARVPPRGLSCAGKALRSPDNRRMLMSKRSLWFLLAVLVITAASGAVAQTTFPGGWIEKDGTPYLTPLNASQIQSIVPQQRGPFTFPSPYNTRAVRITDASDCGGQDCGWYVGYSYSRNPHPPHTHNR